jgi:hypothetical protein
MVLCMHAYLVLCMKVVDRHMDDAYLSMKGLFVADEAFQRG